MSSESSQRSSSACQAKSERNMSIPRAAMSACVSNSHNRSPASTFSSSTTAPLYPPQSRSVSSQTALVPCAACAHVQSSLKESVEACVCLCQTLGLDSFLQHLLMAVEDTGQLGQLTASDLAQWACEQRRDMGRIGKHITEVRHF